MNFQKLEIDEIKIIINEGVKRKRWKNTGRKKNVLEKKETFFEAVKSRIVIKDSIWEIKAFGGKEQRYKLLQRS